MNNNNVILMDFEGLNALLPDYVELTDQIALTLSNMEDILNEMTESIGSAEPHKLMENIKELFYRNEKVFNQKLENVNEFFVRQLQNYGAISEDKVSEFKNIADKID